MAACKCVGLDASCAASNPGHQVLQVTLRSGDIFALDLASAQFGHYEPVMRWSSYISERISKIECYEEASESQKTLNVHDASTWKILEEKKKISEGAHTESDMHYVLCQMNLFMLMWQQMGKVSIKDLLGMQTDKFEVKLQNLVDFVDFNLQPEHLEGSRPFFTVRGRAITEQYPHVGEVMWLFDE